MTRKSPTSAIDALRLLPVFRLDFSPLVVDDDEMQTRGFQEASKVVHPRISRGVLSFGDDVVRNPGARRELSLAEVGDRAGGPNVPICWEIAHDLSVAHRRAREAAIGVP